MILLFQVLDQNPEASRRSRVNTILENQEISIDKDSKIIWKNYPIGKMKKGHNYLNPEIEIIADDALPKNSKDDLNIFLKGRIA